MSLPPGLPPSTLESPPEERLFLAGAPDRAALLATLERTIAALEAGRSAEDAPGNPGDPERLAIVSPPDGLAERLKLAHSRLSDGKRARLIVRERGVYFASGAVPGRVAFLFPGQGSQRIGMLRELYERLPPVRAWFDALDDAYRRRGEPPPSALMFPPDSLTEEQRRAVERDLFDIGHGAQLGTVANLALNELLTRLGVVPDAVLGHSNGEHAAVMVACTDTVTQRDALCDWLRHASLAGRRLGLPAVAERMAAVSAVPRARLDALVAERPDSLFLAMDNCPRQQVLGGRQDAIAAAAEAIAAGGGLCGELPFNRAYHTPLFADWAETLAACYEALPLRAARLPVFSCLSCGPMDADPASVRAAMTAQWTAPVRLGDAIAALHDSGVRTFVEVGPDAKLTAFVEDTLRGRPHLAVASSSAHRGDVAQLRHLLAALHAQGLTVNPQALDTLLSSPFPSLQSPLPSGERVRVRGPRDSSTSGPRATPSPPPSPQRGEGDARATPSTLSAITAAQSALIADTRASLARMDALARSILSTAPTPPPPPAAYPLLGNGERRFTPHSDPFLIDHSLGRRRPGSAAPAPLPVLSFTTSLEITAEGARRAAGRGGPLVLGDVRAHRWMALDQGSLTLRCAYEQRGVALSEPDNPAGPAFEATLEAVGTAPPAPALPAPEPDARPPSRWTPERFYRDYAFHGPCFQGIRRVTALGPASVEADLVVTTLPGLDGTALQLDPALIDCAGQLVAFWLLERHRPTPDFGIFPFAARRVTLYRSPPPPGAAVRCRGRIALEAGVATEADFLFTTADGHPIAAVEGFRQRLLEIPEALGGWIFRGEAAAFSHPVREDQPGVVRRVDPADWDILNDAGGIWARALSCLLLSEAERAAWLALPPSPERRTRWLLSRIAAKEAARRWAERRGLAPPELYEIEVTDGPALRGPVFADRPPSLEFHADGGAVLAVLS
ncbi:acyltransferase domain-containing protein [Azospirillum sp. sgz302134]